MAYRYPPERREQQATSSRHSIRQYTCRKISNRRTDAIQCYEQTHLFGPKSHCKGHGRRHQPDCANRPVVGEMA